MSFGVATLRALVRAGDKTSGDARSWYMISGDAKSWVVIACIYSLSYSTIVQLIEILAHRLGRVYRAYVDLETISQADRAQSSRVPVPLPDDPFVAIRQAQLVDTESEPEEAPSEEL
ncbi:hypothetical protein Tco_0008981 [Tanacetum coccineum]